MAASIPTTMRAWQYSSTTGGLEKNLVLKTDVAVPSLSPVLGDSEILVEVISASINPADYKVPELGLLARAVIRTPATPGMDFCGRVVKATRTVDSFAIGEIVFGRKEPGQQGTCGQYIVVPVNSCVSLPKEGITPDQAASIGVAGVTAYLSISPNVKAGDSVFINGGSGGTGTYGIQIAKALGCHVTVSCSTAKVSQCKSLGADEVIDYTTTDVSQTLRQGGPLYTLCVDNVGTPDDLYNAADDYLLPTGKFVQVGSPVSLNSAKTLGSRMLLPSFLGGGKRKFELFVVRGPTPDAIFDVARMVVDGKVKPVIEETFEFEDLPRAFEKLKTGRNSGKLVIHVAKN